MISRTLLVGDRYYNWVVMQKQPFDYQELKIWQVEDRLPELVIDILNDTKVTPKLVHRLIEQGLQQHWAARWRWDSEAQPVQVHYSLAEEHDLVQQICRHTQQRIASIDRAHQMTELRQLEKQLSLNLPTLFKQLYLYVAPSDFGPDYGFFPLLEDNEKHTSIWSNYQAIQGADMNEYDWQWAEYLVPFLHWGTQIYSCIDCQSREGSIWVLDMNLKATHKHWKSCVWKHFDTLYDWLNLWLQSGDNGRTLWLDMYRKRGLIG